MDHIHVVSEVIEKCAEYSKLLLMAFIDYEKAFDSADSDAVLRVLKDHQGMEETCIRLLEGMYKGCTVRVTLHKKSEKFPIRKRVR